MKSVLIIVWIVIGIITMGTFYLTRDEGCFSLLSIPFLLTIMFNFF